MAADVEDSRARATTANLQSEFHLRSIEPPYNLVRDELDALTAASVAVLEQIAAEDPLRYEQIETEVQRDLNAFKKARDVSKS